MGDKTAEEALDRGRGRLETTIFSQLAARRPGRLVQRGRRIATTPTESRPLAIVSAPEEGAPLRSRTWVAWAFMAPT